MIEHRIAAPAKLADSIVVAAVERVCAQAGLTLSLKTTLKKYPGSMHWHLKRHSESGVLEVTWWQGTSETQTPRLWLSTHGNREAKWITELMPRLGSMLEQELRA